MVSILFRRSLVCGIILLFFGASVISGIGGPIVRTVNKSTEEVLTVFPLDDDYVNAYWKFDEGGGNIAHDSSGHDYDGTIYGATWVGEPGNAALDFDGVDDYVDLDAHAENYLGFNRTDDLIFSFYFISTSSDSGMIYSISNDPEYGYMPGAHIALCPNGTLEFEVWFEGICGITLNTVNTYNDGDLHYVEVWYDGIIYPLNQILKIFVDGELDNSMESEMCKFYADQFETAKIGRKSYEPTDYFDGILDDLKIIKYPGGNQPPTINISGPTSGEAGVEYNYTFLIIDPEGDDVWFYVDWGDGTAEEWIGPYESGVEVTTRKVWYENGTYEIKAKARDSWGEGPESSLIVIIGNQVPNSPVIHGPPSGKIGTEYSYTFVATDPDGDNVQYFIDWDDDDTEWTDYHASGEVVTVKHSWDEEGTYTIQAKAKDTDGAESGWGKLTVTMPRNKAFNFNFNLLERLLKQFPNLFPIIRTLLEL